ncbi:hypothetical protein B4U80_03743 [Leptotrombidium deliense]|uniref:DNA methyltransferase 1-associated protein 1 n=1 Tax=Leptotrombidium deliense TaxID=299467 RepID=A0A443SEX7_9ACAR|nr:hypothetical protein B4U80_03743 [Leptotrombidium deliense]
MSDVMDILELDKTQTIENGTKDTILTSDSLRNKFMSTKKKSKVEDKSFSFKKPEGMHRELYALLYADSKDGAPIIPTDVMPSIGNSGGYKQIKAKLGLKKVRPWKWMPFSNPGRTDSFMLHHWRRVADESKEYPFAKFNKTVPIPSYTENEYHQILQTDGWTKNETDHLFALCRRFDLRFFVIHDRWDRDTYQTSRSVEDLKERYYNVCNLLSKSRMTTNGQEVKTKVFDADHERKRKEQLIKLYNRTPEQVEEEQKLLEEFKKIEMRKKEREKKTQDLQKLITAADNNSQSKKLDNSGSVKSSSKSSQRSGRGPGRKRVTHKTSTSSATPTTPGTPSNLLEMSGIKFPEIKTSGTSLRSQRMKLPSSIGQKKMKAIEQLLLELNIELRPMPTEDICNHFNELRSDMVLLYELKQAISNCEYELQTLKHQYEALQPGKQLEIPALLNISNSSKEVAANESAGNISQILEAETPKKSISEVIDVTAGVSTPTRKRRAALEQGNLLRKLKKI